MPELRLDNISYRYRKGRRDVLSGISCVFAAGQLSAVVGPSGSGKTTLLSILAGLDEPGGGSVYVDGEDMSGLDLDLYRRERASMIFQSFHLFPLLTALENVCFPMEMLKVAKKQAVLRAGELLESVGISGELHGRYPSNLSGGEQQRVAIARALATGAKILLADEPTGNLDVENSENIVGILKELAHGEQMCVVIVTHDHDIAAATDCVLRLSDGRIAPQEG